MIVAMVVLGGIGHLPGVILGACCWRPCPRCCATWRRLQSLTGGRLDASILRQLLIALAMIIIMLLCGRAACGPRRSGRQKFPAAE